MSFEMMLKSIWVVQVDGMYLRRVFGCGLNMVVQQFVKFVKFGFVGVFQIEFEGLYGCVLVKDFEVGIVVEDIENGMVCFLQEFELGSDDGLVGVVVRLFI